MFRAQELCESRGGRPGLPSLIDPNKPTVSVDFKQHSTINEFLIFLRLLSFICQPDI